MFEIYRTKHREKLLLELLLLISIALGSRGTFDRGAV